MKSTCSKPRLVIVGASVRSAAQCAVRAGFQILAIDQFMDRDLAELGQVASLQSLSAIEESTWQPWIGSPVLLCGGMENRLQEVEHLLHRGVIGCLPLEILRELRRVDSWSRWAHGSGLQWPETIEGSVKPPNREYPWLVKSRSSAGGLGVRFWHGESLDSFEYVQQWVEGDCLGVTFWSDQQESRIVGCMASWAADAFDGPLPFLYRGSVGPIELTDEESRVLAGFAERVRTETGLIGVWEADFVRNQHGWWLLEINPRWTSSMELLEVVHHVSLVEKHVATIAGVTQSIQPSFRQKRLQKNHPHTNPGVIGKVIHYAAVDIHPTESMLQRLWNHRWDGTWDALGETNRTADIPATRAAIPRGYPICTEYAVGGTIAEVQSRLRGGVSFLDGGDGAKTSAP
jgi:predicted ATP-grasp superfamily ATP-dependent carboligase